MLRDDFEFEILTPDGTVTHEQKPDRDALCTLVDVQDRLILCPAGMGNYIRGCDCRAKRCNDRPPRALISMI